MTGKWKRTGCFHDAVYTIGTVHSLTPACSVLTQAPPERVGTYRRQTEPPLRICEVQPSIFHKSAINHGAFGRGNQTGDARWKPQCGVQAAGPNLPIKATANSGNRRRDRSASIRADNMKIAMHSASAHCDYGIKLPGRRSCGIGERRSPQSLLLGCLGAFIFK